MLRHILTLTTFYLLAFTTASGTNDDQENMYRFRYQQADLMKTAESKAPVSEYEVAEGYIPNEELHPEASLAYMNTGGMGGAGFGGGYYPGAFMGGAGGIGMGGAGGIGMGGAGGIGMGGVGMGGGGIGMGGGGIGIGYPGLMGGGGFMGGFGGEVIDKKAFVDEGKKAGGGTFEKAGGQVGQEFKAGQGGYNKGKVFVNNAQLADGYEKQKAGEKKAIEDGKQYYGGKAFNQEGKNAGEKSGKAGHKKGHKIKGFKTTHHKDESGKTEEFYDEEHDEGSDYFHKNEKGAFGENAGAAFKGGHDNGVFNSGEKGHQANYKKEELLNKDKAEQGQFGSSKFGGDQKAYGLNTGIDHHSLHELQEGNKMYKHFPYHVPFHKGVGRK
ncbi:glycine-rich cell wall structural protein 1.8-like isoform X2 [Agrilus planipennis]|nr:glycine-rich cell wall structural protein 1.8-like isoform X2 [Agrilus planipennis]